MGVVLLCNIVVAYLLLIMQQRSSILKQIIIGFAFSFTVQYYCCLLPAFSLFYSSIVQYFSLTQLQLSSLTLLDIFNKRIDNVMINTQYS